MTKLRYLTAGESHGPALTAIIEGFPAGVPLNRETVDRQLARRQQGYGRGGRMKIESDRVEFLSGVRDGLTLGSPITLSIANRDWSNWQEVTSPYPEEINPGRVAEKKVSRPRPGHADLAGALKYNHSDLRNVLERASARETAARVAVGSVAMVLLERLGCAFYSQVVQVGSVAVTTVPDDLAEIGRLAENSPLRCADAAAEKLMIGEIDSAQAKGDTLGGVFEVIVTGLPPGLGSYVHPDRRLDAALAAALMSIPSVKGVEIGLGFRGASLPGSAYHDPISYSPERGYYRQSNHAGGLEGGVSNGEPLLLRGAVKPIPTLRQPLPSVDLESKQVDCGAYERSDTCVVPAAAVVAEAMTAWVLAGAVLEKFGGDSWQELHRRWDDYRNYLKER